ncbi:transposase family protein [Streptomyces bacillaris]|uniref:transposase family protein n=1 Tax=Streptomyces bacillaris TaxID=68179 RepID=UPI0037FE4363
MPAVPAKLSPLDADRVAELSPYLEAVPDPRSCRGRWYSLVSVLLVCACVAVSGAKSLDEIAERATNTVLASLTPPTSTARPRTRRRGERGGSSPSTARH